MADHTTAKHSYPDHEAHGRCQNCGCSAHRYPYGWDHVGTGMNACNELEPMVTCCHAHVDTEARNHA